jgi:hypothetical protein
MTDPTARFVAPHDRSLLPFELGTILMRDDSAVAAHGVAELLGMKVKTPLRADRRATAMWLHDADALV